VARPPVSPSDDVSEFLDRIPGSYFFVGAGRVDGTSGMHHNPGFAIDEACMPIAATVLASIGFGLISTFRPDTGSPTWNIITSST